MTNEKGKMFKAERLYQKQAFLSWLTFCTASSNLQHNERFQKENPVDPDWLWKNYSALRSKQEIALLDNDRLLTLSLHI